MVYEMTLDIDLELAEMVFIGVYALRLISTHLLLTLYSLEGSYCEQPTCGVGSYVSSPGY